MSYLRQMLARHRRRSPAGALLVLTGVLLALAAPAALSAATPTHLDGDEEGVNNADEDENPPARPVRGSSDAPLLLPVGEQSPSQAERSKSTSFVERYDLEGQHAENMNDYLFSMIPGVTVARRSNLGFMGPNSGFYIRGLRGERVAVFVDGVPSQVNNHFHPLVDQYTPDMLERIEITRGPSTVLHGASAAGGVIDIYTHKASRGFSSYVDVSAGRFDTREARLRLGYGWEGGSFEIGTTDRETDGHRPNAIFNANTLNLKLRQQLTERWTLGLRGGRTISDFGDPGPVGAPRESLTAQDPSNLALTFERELDDSESMIALYWNRATVDSLRNRSGRITGFERFDESETGVRLMHAWTGRRGRTFTAGLDAVTYDDERTTGPTVPMVKNSESFLSPYFQWDAELADDLRLDAGVRATVSDQFGTDVSPEIGVIKNLSDDLTLRGRAGKAFRVPRVDDVNAPFAVPNQDLEPEDFYHAEVGLNRRLGRRSAFDVAAWWMEGDNLIRVIGNGSLAQRVNTGEFTHFGVESTLSLEVLEGLVLHFGLGISDLDDDTAQVPERTFDFGFDYRRGDFRVGLTSRYAEELFGSDNRRDPLPDYYVADLHLEYQVLDELAIYVDLDNVTDEEYQTIAGYPQVPRAAFFGARWGWSEAGTR